MGEPDAESGPYNLCKYKHFAPHAHAILRFFRAHKPTMALLSPAEPLSHSALCFYRGNFPGDSFRCPPSCFRRGATFRLPPQIVCWLRRTARLLSTNLSPASRQSFRPSHCRRKEGKFGRKMGKKTGKAPAFSVPPPLFSHRDASPALSEAAFSPRASDRQNRCRGRTLQPTAHRAAAGTVCVGHATDAHHSRAHRPAARRRETKTPPVYENRPGAGIGMCRPRSRNCRATDQRLPLRLPKSPVNPRRRRKSL